MNTTELEALLEPVLPLLEPGVVRLVVHRHGVVADRMASSTALAAALTPEAFEQSIAELQLPRRLSAGAMAVGVGENIVLFRPPDCQRGSEALAHEGSLSALAARLLSHAVGLGRNVLFVGPWAACMPMAAALVAEGRRPAVIGFAGDVAPRGWSVLRDARDVQLLGADRIAAWSLDLTSLGQLMGRCCGVVGWCEARTLPQALMRYECALSAPAELRVAASLDVVVVVSQFQGARVEQVFEIVAGDDAYRAALLFTIGQAPVVHALVPVGLPSFLGDLERSGQTVLADDLRHAIPERPTGAPTAPGMVMPAADGFPDIAYASAPSVAAARSAEVGVTSAGQLTPVRRDVTAPRRLAPARESHLYEQAVDADLASAPPPGWELDQLPDVAVQSGEAGIVDPDAARIAASFGLAPPPRPAGVPEPQGSFAEALDRVRRAARESGE